MATKTKLRFTARLVPAGRNDTSAFLHFPFDMQKTFGSRARVPVCGTINGYPFRSSLMPRGGRHILCINQEMRAGAKAQAGQLARFVLQRDDQPRVVVLPPALKKMLVAKPRVKAVFDGLSYSHRKEYAAWIAQAKQLATVQCRVKKLTSVLLAKAKSKR